MLWCKRFSLSLKDLITYTERKKKRRVEFFPSYFNHLYGVYYSHTLLQIVLWMWTAGIRVFGRCAIYPVCEIIQPCTTQCIARTIRKAKISCKTSMFKPSAQDFVTPFGTLQRYTTLFDSFTDFFFIFTLLWTFFQSWYDWLMFRGVGQLRCWCRVRGNSKLPIILGLTSQQLNVSLDV